MSEKVRQHSMYGARFFGVRFTTAQEKALCANSSLPRWDLNPPQREEFESDRAYAIGLRNYADRLIAAAPERGEGRE